MKGALPQVRITHYDRAGKFVVQGLVVFVPNRPQETNTETEGTDKLTPKFAQQHSWQTRVTVIPQVNDFQAEQRLPRRRAAMEHRYVE